MDITLTPTLKPDFKPALTSQSSPDSLLSGWAEVYEQSQTGMEDSKEISLPESGPEDAEAEQSLEEVQASVYQGWMTPSLWVESEEPLERGGEQGDILKIQNMPSPAQDPTSCAPENVGTEGKGASLPLEQIEKPLTLDALNLHHQVMQEKEAEPSAMQPLVASEVQPLENKEASSSTPPTVESLKVSSGTEKPQEESLSSGQQNLGQQAETMTPTLIIPSTERGSFADQVNPTASFESSASPVSPAISQTLSQLKLHMHQGVHTFTIHLNPEDLGHIQVRLEVHPDRHIALHMQASNAETMGLLKDQTLALQKLFEEAHFIAEKQNLQFSWQNSEHQNPRQASRFLMSPHSVFDPAEDHLMRLPHAAWSFSKHAPMGSSLYSLLI